MVKERAAAYRIQDLDQTDRPRERLAEHGAQALTNAELLAILLRVGMEGENAVEVGQRLLNTFGGLHGLHRASFAEMCAQKGLGQAKAAQIKAAIELGKRLRLEAPEERSAIHGPGDVAALLQYEMAALTQEHLRVILLDTRNRVIFIEPIYVGSLNASTVRVGELFKAAIQRSAAAILIVHNHPSGDPTPSPEDVNLTRAAVQAGKLMDIEVLDHVVIGRG
ncbi:MAG TPA: DNA repair protein RadC, partial [Anaerolineaceae bacterium]|nr:DNA repair protein RadC [Anaerolineaceae bacterium]